jgi:tetraacyldisaccharide 4'-kinase
MGPLEFLYYTGCSLRKSLDMKSRKRLPCRVVSIGNITTGGTGKTPAVIALAERSMDHGYFPCILTRGYRGKAKGPCIVSTGGIPILDVEAAGDEALLMAHRLSGIPIVKGNDRYGAGMYVLDNLRREAMDQEKEILFILDDGFQHWKLFRDIDVLLIDRTNPFGNRRLLPIGRLREPLREIGRADVIVITKTAVFSSRLTGKTPASQSHQTDLFRNIPTSEAGLDDLIAEVRTYNPGAPIFLSEHLPVYLSTASGHRLPVEALKGKDVIGFCGIGNPMGFTEMIEHMGGKVKGFFTFRDHYRFTARDLTRIIGCATKSGAGWIVTTEKDIMRLAGFDLPENLVAVGIEWHVEDGFYDYILRRPE